MGEREWRGEEDVAEGMSKGREERILDRPAATPTGERRH